MARKNFETHIKDKLNERVLTPSDAAWGKLSGELDPEKGTNTKTFWFVAVAAVFIGLITFSVVFYNHAGLPDKNEGIVVEKPIITEDRPNEIPKPNSIQELPKPHEAKIVDRQTKPATEKGRARMDVPHPVQNDASLIVVLPKALPQPKVLPVHQQEILESKIFEVLEQVAQMEEGNSLVTDAEVDSLLKRAQRELFSEKIFRENSSVDPLALLADVENEMDKSFREQIFELMKDGYLKVKTAVAVRNN